LNGVVDVVAVAMVVVGAGKVVVTMGGSVVGAGTVVGGEEVAGAVAPTRTLMMVLDVWPLLDPLMVSVKFFGAIVGAAEMMSVEVFDVVRRGFDVVATVRPFGTPLTPR
jgi:hypothetical protein